MGQDIVELIAERGRAANRAMRDWMDDVGRRAVLECLCRNCREVADDPDEFPPEEEPELRGLEYWIHGKGPADSD